jgi:hypothetical protein
MAHYIVCGEIARPGTNQSGNVNGYDKAESDDEWEASTLKAPWRPGSAASMPPLILSVWKAKMQLLLIKLNTDRLQLVRRTLPSSSISN